MSEFRYRAASKPGEGVGLPRSTRWRAARGLGAPPSGVVPDPHRHARRWPRPRQLGWKGVGEGRMGRPVGRSAVGRGGRGRGGCENAAARESRRRGVRLHTRSPALAPWLLSLFKRQIVRDPAILPGAPSLSGLTLIFGDSGPRAA